MRQSMGGALVCGSSRRPVRSAAGLRRLAAVAGTPVQLLPEVPAGRQAFFGASRTANGSRDADAAAPAGAWGLPRFPAHDQRQRCCGPYGR